MNKHGSLPFGPMARHLPWVVLMGLVWLLTACSSTHQRVIETPTQNQEVTRPAVNASGALAGMPNTPDPDHVYRSRWVAAQWSDLPGWGEDSLQDAWNAWLHNCERPGPVFGPLCNDVRTLILANDEDRRLWMMTHLRPYRLESLDGQSQGLLTSYYEPIFDASEQPRDGFTVPLYAPPPALLQAKRARQPWYSRQEIDTLPQAQQALQGQALAWLASPIDALILQIQGSGLMRLTQSDGSVVIMRLSFAGSNEQPYQSVGRWLLDRGYVKDASWAGIKAWIASQQDTNPALVQEMFWSNPRYIFFREDKATLDAGPKGAQGVPLTPGRSVAVDKDSVAYGTPLWLASNGPAGTLQKLVFAQDTGSAIVGAVRADYFAGTGSQAGDWAGQVKQNLRLWALWPQ